ncbi:MAPEG family protein [Altererythrobacter sp. KTW20L]|uniref:MAPEG family protein n=1 Tax=Altererythrobacter sp. KTW20L TaxID=2942210 RepID=UPI0020C06E3A|nr:MAPEG family protein [Altererythrobacter sp. KTW20L]MCL6249506.1 MAPEG family protein [Altererythrobacter sp. KTW20L]
MGDLHISLLSAALAALVTGWLGWRCGNIRLKEKILHGDGGNALLHRRMRAQSNFTEYTPIALVLILVLDLADQDGWLLGLTALAFMVGRVLHAIGMDADTAARPRMIGMMLTLPLLVLWAGWAIAVAFRLV